MILGFLFVLVLGIVQIAYKAGYSARDEEVSRMIDRIKKAFELESREAMRVEIFNALNNYED